MNHAATSGRRLASSLCARGIPNTSSNSVLLNSIVDAQQWSTLLNRSVARQHSKSLTSIHPSLTTTPQTYSRTSRRGFASSANDSDSDDKDNKDKEDDSEDSGDDSKEGEEEEVKANDDDSASQDDSEDSELAKTKATLSSTKDALLRALAEQENIRMIARRDVSNATSFAVTKLAKSLLDVSDNLDRALTAVTEEQMEGNADLKVLHEGVSMTADLLAKSFASSGLTSFTEPGDTFDPERHDAMFEYEDEAGEGGTVGQVMKKGFELNGRVIRPGQVGVIKKK
mmetsp:Transcript_19565/g.39111  ORF Transcript_19565/g.39111 Transcript_19565/m.39111 type:complete len:284 (-) Transcript_19565:82-933(-)|eukprot:CAMPEP_0182456064 /NCGR_PEP_ID=MMETSP1319-20130603/2016_1 /TAXON_ID=172717 /ORGANISM="Bolidomonas pacifica, Strain RCC208" /LENGTH=283 /DNA_ID=CAMNT_0024654239 /DNA_START=386 /DNA_END=1237 /DNA_ORIENTATION=+